MYLEVQGITTWTFSVADGKGSARPSRPGVSCIQENHDYSIGKLSWCGLGRGGFLAGSQAWRPIGQEEDTSHVFSLRSQSLKEGCWAILALLDGVWETIA